MSGRSFVDTNVLVYAHDRAAGRRHEAARELIQRLWTERTGVVSTQVIQEFYVNVRRKAAKPVSRAEARRLVEDYLAWETVVNDSQAIIEALDLEARYRISFWDAL
jgi:predicted nucleic acid-binding protein